MKGRLSALSMCASIASIAICSLAQPAFAADKAAPLTAWEASRKVDDNDVVTTGVARGRDRLDSATSTSSIKENEISRIAPRSMAELFRNIPGIRVEAGGGDTNNGFTVRGLPMVQSGAKYVQIQEDGLPVMEFGDINSAGPDSFTRVDFNIGQVESIRGGSASTFASNAPGGAINLISKTGEVEGGSVQATTGLDYQTYRMDFDYGGHLSDTWRFHVGGFYREGEGPRKTGANSFRGGQIKFNVTKQFDGGYIRFYGKFLDDRTPIYQTYPAAISGTNANPIFKDLPGFSIVDDSLLSRYITTVNTLRPGGQTLASDSLSDGVHSLVKSVGFESQFNIGEWNVSERFRYSDMNGSISLNFPVLTAQAGTLAAFLGIPAASFSYANGPLKGTPFPSASGNGYLSMSVLGQYQFHDLTNVTNDLRISRVWQVGGGDLTTTAGVYKANQKLNRDLGLETVLQDVVGGGNSSLIDVASGGFRLSTDGIFLGGSPGGNGNVARQNVAYGVLAPYGSFNFKKGRIAIGGSLRYDRDTVSGDFANAGTSARCVDVNGDGVTTPGTAECKFAFIPASASTPVKYSYGYLSYSAGINFRISDPFAVFARYSRGSRAGTDKILSTPPISGTTGALLDKKSAYDPVRQAELGVKFRKNGVTLNLTGFYATVSETNTQVNRDPATGLQRLQLVQRGYKAYGMEFEGGIRRGPLSLTAGATVTGAEITADNTNPAIVGNLPRHQPTLLFSLTPQYDSDQFSIGANVIGQTGSYAQDVNQLRLPGYTTVGAFIQYRPVKRVELSLNASNLFNQIAITESPDAAINTLTNTTLIRTLYGRTVSASARFFF